MLNITCPIFFKVGDRRDVDEEPISAMSVMSSMSMLMSVTGLRRANCAACAVLYALVCLCACLSVSVCVFSFLFLCESVCGP